MRAPASFAAALLVSALAPSVHAATPAARPTLAFRGTGQVTAHVLNLRAGPTAKSKDLGDIPRNTKLALTAHTKDRFREDASGASFWYHTTWKGKAGWVWGGYLKISTAAAPPPAHTPTQVGGRPTVAYPGHAYVITAVLNLRAGPTTSSRDIGDVKRNTKLTLHARTVQQYSENHAGLFRWYDVSFAGKRGWVYGAFIRFGTPPPPPAAPTGAPGFAGYGPRRGASLASKSYALHNGLHSQHMCLGGVEASLRSSIIRGYHSGQPGASQWGQYAKSHGAAMANVGLRVAGTPGRGSSFPKGTIMVFSAGRCGFNPTWGHIEVVVDHEVACSDFCRRRTDSWCSPSLIVYPTGQ